MNALDELFNNEITHEIDTTRIVQGHEAVCTCGAWCVSFHAHLQEVNKYRQNWDEMVRKHGHPLETMAKTLNQTT